MTEVLTTAAAAGLATELATVGPVVLVLAVLAGSLIGAAFFGGLWWTAHRAAASAQPALWIFASLLLRMGGALIGFQLVGGGQWPRLLACLIGFVLARLVVLRLTRPAVVSTPSAATTTADALHPSQEGHHASEPR